MRARLPNLQVAYRAASEVRRLSPDLVLDLVVERHGDEILLTLPDDSRDARVTRRIITRYGGIFEPTH